MKRISKAGKYYKQVYINEVYYNVEEGVTLDTAQKEYLEGLVYNTQDTFCTDVFCVWVNKSKDSTDGRLHNLNIVFDKSEDTVEYPLTDDPWGDI